LDPYWVPSSVYPQLKYTGGLFYYLLWDENPAMEEPYPPGTWVKRLDPTTNMLLVGSVVDFPPSSDTLGSPVYKILFKNDTAALIPLADMSLLILPPPVSNHLSLLMSSGSGSSLLPPFLTVGSCITYKHSRTYHKGYLTQTMGGTYCFSFKSHIKNKTKDWGINLPNLPFNWVDLCTERILLPGHIAHSFI
jgi:hypothetical protein